MATQLSSEKYKNEKKRFRGLFVGPTGAGKTLGAASWPGKTLIEDFDKRHAPITSYFQDRLEDYFVDVITPSNYWSVFAKTIKELATYNPYENIIIDGVTTLSTTTVVMQMIAKGAMDDWSKRSEADIKKAGVGKVTAGGVVVPTWDEFNGEAMLVSTLLESLKSFDCNLFLSAHPINRTKIEGTKGVKYTSITTFGPKVESIIPTYFDEVWFFDVELTTDNNGKPIARRVVYTQPSEQYAEAKTAIKGIPAKIDITDKRLYDVVKEYL